MGLIMRTVVCGALLFASLVFAMLMASDRTPQAAPWCAEMTAGATNCGFYSFRQCQAYVSGVGGFCNENEEDEAYTRLRSYEEADEDRDYARAPEPRRVTKTAQAKTGRVVPRNMGLRPHGRPVTAKHSATQAPHGHPAKVQKIDRRRVAVPKRPVRQARNQRPNTPGAFFRSLFHL